MLSGNLLVALLVLGVGIGLVLWAGRFLLFLVLGGVPWLLRTGFRLLLRRPLDTYGTATWATESDYADLLTEGAGVVLGQTPDGRTLIDRSEAHCLILGPTGSRKSTGVFVPTLEAWDGSALVVDLKGELAQLTGDARKRWGDVCTFAPTRAESIKLNVADLVRWDSSQKVGDCQRLAAALVSETAEEWRADVQALLTALLLHAKAEGQGHLAGVLSWMTAAPLDDRLQRLIESREPVVRAQGMQMLSRSDRMRSLVWNASVASLAIWWDPRLAEHTSRSDLDLLSLASGLRPTTVYLCLPEGDLIRLKSLLVATLEMLVGRLTDSAPGSQRHALLLGLDEFAALGELRVLEASAAYLRGYKVRVMLGVQSLKQIRQRYGVDSPLPAQCKTWWCAAPSDPDDARVISTRLGVKTVSRLATNASYYPWSIWTAEREGEVHSGRALMTPDEVSRLPAHEAVILREGQPPIRAVKIGAPLPPRLQDVRRRLPRHVLPGVNLLLIAIALASWALWGRSPAPPPAAVGLTSEAGKTPAAVPAGDMTAALSPQTRRVSLPIMYVNPPPGLHLQGRVVERVEVDLRTIEREEYGRLVVNLRDLRAGPNYAFLTHRQLVLPEGVSVPRTLLDTPNPRLNPTLLELNLAPDIGGH